MESHSPLFTRRAVLQSAASLAVTAAIGTRRPINLPPAPEPEPSPPREGKIRSQAEPRRLRTAELWWDKKQAPTGLIYETSELRVNQPLIPRYDEMGEICGYIAGRSTMELYLNHLTLPRVVFDWLGQSDVVRPWHGVKLSETQRKHKGLDCFCFGFLPHTITRCTESGGLVVLESLGGYIQGVDWNSEPPANFPFLASRLPTIRYQ